MSSFLEDDEGNIVYFAGETLEITRLKTKTKTL